MDWNLDDYYPGLESDAFRRAFDGLASDLEGLLADAQALPALSPDEAEAWVVAVLRYEELSALCAHVSGFVACHRACDGRDPVARRVSAELAGLGALLTKIDAELERGVGAASEEARQALLADERVADLGYFVERLQRDVEHRMDPAQEGLAADLGVDGMEAWGRLYSSVASSLEFEMRWPDGRVETLPMSQRRAIMRRPDRAVRQAAFTGGNAAWEGVRDVLAPALNAIAGTRLTLYRHREVDHFLDAALDDGGISREALEAMLAAVEAEADLPRRFLRRKAALMGRDTIAWFDLEAPLEHSSGRPIRCGALKEASPDWETGVGMVRDAFGAYPALQRYLEHAIDQRWVEHSPRAGKQPGAWCSSSPVIGQSRVFMTYADALADVSTLAHEIGHGYHAWVMREQRPLARRYPMTLAESASTFAELILNEGLLRDERLDDGQRAVLLGEALGDAASFLLDITTRFRFEEAFYQRRQEGELSADELDALMAETQRSVFGDVLDPEGTDPLFWASKLHFFITGVSFYNFPYTFGYLLSRGMHAMLHEEGDAFLGRYERFLQRSGSDWAHRVARDTLGVDLEKPDFWRNAIRSLEAPLDQLEALVAPA